MKKNNKEYIILEENKDVKTYLGYLRKEYNSYHFKTPSSNIITTLDSKAKRNIHENIKANELLKRAGKEEYALPNVVTKKSRNFSLKMIKGSSIIIKDGVILLKTKGVHYKFQAKKLNLKDYIYTNCIIGIKDGIYYICVDKTKKVSFSRYIGGPDFHRRKSTLLKRELSKFRLGLLTKQDVGLLEQNFRKNLLQFIFDLDKKFSNIKLKTKIFDLYQEYINNLKEENLRELYYELYSQYNLGLTPTQNKLLQKIFKVKVQ